MPVNKKKKTQKNKKSSIGISKFASLTSGTLSKAFSNYKKSQEIKKIKEIKLKKLEENNKLVKEKKRVKNMGRKTTKRK